MLETTTTVKTTDYRISQVAERVFFIRWYRSPPANQVYSHFLENIERILQEANEKIYIISDLRRGSIANVETLLKLSNIARHKHWGAGTSFSKNTATAMYAGLFGRFAQTHGSKDKAWERPEDALAYLESIESGITEGIDWAAIIGWA